MVIQSNKNDYIPQSLIFNGDFRDLLKIDCLADENSYIDRVITITDPPYNQKYHYQTYEDSLNQEDYVELLAEIPRPCVIIHYPEETINLLPKAFKTHCDDVITWVYNGNTFKNTRLISFWGCKPILNKVKQPYKNQNDKRIKQLIENGSKGARSYDWLNINQVKNVSNEKTSHPCQIPEELIEKIILMTCKDGDLIFDPFAGSGTTLKVAQDLGFHSIGSEMDKTYFDIIKSRLRFTTELNPNNPIDPDSSKVNLSNFFYSRGYSL